MMNFNPPHLPNTRRFNLQTGIAEDVQTHVPSQNPPIRKVASRTAEEDAGLAAQREARVREQGRLEAERARIANDPSMEAARAWLRGRSLQQAVLELFVMIKALEGKKDDRV
jgi:hypothetical protein